MPGLAGQFCQMESIPVSHITCKSLSFPGFTIVNLYKPVFTHSADPPRILTQLPSELTWIEGNPQELNCATDGKPKPKVTWRKDGREIKRGRRTAKIAFRSVSYKDEGLYQCVAKNIGGKKTTEVQINILCK